MTRRATILIYFIIIPALVGLVTKEVDGRVFHPTDRLFGLKMRKAVGLVPASRKDVEGDLAAYGVSMFTGQVGLSEAEAAKHT